MTGRGGDLTSGVSRGELPGGRDRGKKFDEIDCLNHDGCLVASWI